MKKKKRTTFKPFLYEFVKITGAIPILLLMRPKVLFASEKAKKIYRGPLIVMSNHANFSDIVVLLILMWYRQIHILAATEVLKGGLRRWFLTSCGAIEVDRENFSFGIFSEICSLLKKNKAVGIFPEGRINCEDNSVSTFKSGVTMMAIRGDAPILPVYIKKNTSIFSRQVVAVGEAINVKDLCSVNPSLAEIENISSVLRDEEIKLMKIVNKNTEEKQ